MTQAARLPQSTTERTGSLMVIAMFALAAAALPPGARAQGTELSGKEVVDAVKQLACEVQAGTLKPSKIDDRAIAERLYAPDAPDPDLLIRTSGEMRTSNFLLWEVAYSELWYTPVFWPDFNRELLFEAIREDLDRIYGDWFAVLGIVLILYGLQDVLSKLSPCIRNTNSATTLTDKRFDSNENALRFTGGFLGKTVIVELVK